jgi:Ca2+-binding EF-hand superfamily protein
METAVRSLGFPFDEEELEAFFNHIDLNHNGRIEYNELAKKFDISLADTRG